MNASGGQTCELRTQRLLLRAWRDDDRAPFAAMNADPVVMEHYPATLTREETDASVERILQAWDAHGWGLWAAEVEGAFAGYVGLWLATFDAPFTPAVEVGWRLARRYWGHGYATEGAQAACAFGFDVVGLDEIVSFTAATNLRSQRVMQKLGMARDPTEDFDHPGLPPDHRLAPHVLYRLRRGNRTGVRDDSV